MPARVISYRGVRYHLHTGLFGIRPAVQPSWDAALPVADALQDKSRRLYRAAQELQRLVGQQLPSRRQGSRVQELAQQVLENIQQVLQHAPA